MPLPTVDAAARNRHSLTPTEGVSLGNQAGPRGLDGASSFAAAALDRQAGLFIWIVTVGLVAVAAIVFYAGFVSPPPNAPAIVSWLAGTMIVGPVFAPVLLLGGLPTEFVVHGDELVIKRRWRREKRLRHTGRAERFPDGDELRRRNMYGTGSPMFSSLVTATTDLPDGKVYYALTDRDRVVLVHGTAGPILVSPADPDGFQERVGQST